MLKDLIKFANQLDAEGLTKEADYLDRLIKSATNEETSDEAEEISDEPEERCILWIDLDEYQMENGGQTLYQGKIYRSTGKEIGEDKHEEAFSGLIDGQVQSKIEEEFGKCKDTWLSDEITVDEIFNPYCTQKDNKFAAVRGSKMFVVNTDMDLEKALMVVDDDFAPMPEQ